jgi:predicted O-linked N-acetylglucosamine transferase (SPINDLY family)
MKKKKQKPQQSTANPAGQHQAMGIDQALGLALRHHQAGDLGTAESIYRQVLAFQPGNPTALHLLGVAAFQRQRYETAVSLISQAVENKPDFAEAHSNLGNAFREMGMLDKAEQSYRRAISVNPGLALAHHNLGNIEMNRGEYREAAACFRRAIKADSRLAEAHTNLGISLKELGHPEEAEKSYRNALAVRPDLTIAQFNLGNTLLDRGQTEEAVLWYERVLARDPGYTGARLNLGGALRDLGRLEEAAACYRRALADTADDPAILVSLGAVLRDLGEQEEAEQRYRRALELESDSPLAHFNLANLLRETGRAEEAIAGYERAVALSPDCAAMYCNLGNALRDAGRLEEAFGSYRKALELEPENADSLVNLGNAFKEAGRYGEAEGSYRKALLARPEMAEAHFNLGTVMQDQCRMQEAVVCFRRAVELNPGHMTAHSNLLMNLQYDPEVTPEAILEESRAWERAHLARIPLLPAPANDRDPDRPLRIGYVSGDLRRHPVGYFLDGVLACHDHGTFEAFCYANQSFGDDLTERLRRNSVHWRGIFGKPDEAVAEMIREDRIDILVDLSGHTARNRLPVFAGRAAPVQATWAGYVGTTGLSAMDYLISDRRETPEGSDAWYCERVVRLPDCYVCYSPPEYAPPVAPLPAARNGFPTFGCFNNLAKINPRVTSLWIRLLREIPDARLLLVTKALGDPSVRERCREEFSRGGVAERVSFSGMLPHLDLLARYGEVDIALDPFPYSGGLTTLEGLWMGVPAVTLGGDRFASRHTLSHLTAAGLTEFIARDEDSYLAVATSLAGDPERLEAIRHGLRDRMAASPLCDCRGFTRNLENAYRAMWREWCAER